MNNPLPIVAIPARLVGTTGHDTRVARASKVFHDVVELIRAAGLAPRIVSEPDADLTGLAGVVLPGGGDIDPGRYGGRTIDALYNISPHQDALDFAIAERGIAAGVPVYGICRGAQVLNVLYGGSLHEDLPPSSVVHIAPATPGCDGDDFVTHEVRIEPGSLLAASMQTTRASVKSAHHQAVNRLGDGLTATAFADDGLVEAFEDRTRWVIGVQWHPEAEARACAVRDGQFAALAAEIARRAGAEASVRPH